MGFRDLLNDAKGRISEIDPAGARRRTSMTPPSSTCGSRTSTSKGPSPAAVFIPRGHLEAQVENRLPDKDRPVVVYCAGGVRSAFAADTLQQLGYRDVTSMAGGFGRWKNEGRPWVTPAVLNPEQRTRYHRHLLLPEVGEAGQQRLLESKVLLLGAGGLGSPAALYLAAAGVGTLGIVDMDVVDASNLQRQILHNIDRIGERKVDSAKKTLTQLNPDVDVVTYDVRLGADNIMEVIDGYDVVVDGTDNFPTRYLLNDASLLAARARGPRVDLPLRGSSHRLPAVRGPLLPLPAPRASTAGAGAELRRSRRARRAARHHRLNPSARGDQTRPRPRRPARRAAARLRRAGGELPHVQGATRSGLPNVWRRRAADRYRRVRRPLPPARHARGRVDDRSLTRSSPPMKWRRPVSGASCPSCACGSGGVEAAGRSCPPAPRGCARRTRSHPWSARRRRRRHGRVPRCRGGPR